MVLRDLIQTILRGVDLREASVDGIDFVVRANAMITYSIHELGATLFFDFYVDLGYYFLAFRVSLLIPEVIAWSWPRLMKNAIWV